MPPARQERGAQDLSIISARGCRARGYCLSVTVCKQTEVNPFAQNPGPAHPVLVEFVGPHEVHKEGLPGYRLEQGPLAYRRGIFVVLGLLAGDHLVRQQSSLQPAVTGSAHYAVAET